MKSEKAKKLLQASSVADSYGYEYVHLESARQAVELAEQEAEERMREKAIEAFKEYMNQMHGGYLSSDVDDFIRNLSEK